MKMEEKQKNSEKLAAAIEAILFVYGEPMGIQRIIKILKNNQQFKKITEEETEEAILKIKNGPSEDERGLALIESKTGENEEYQLATKPEFGTLLENFVKEEFKESLSPASLETLSLVAYLGPLSRAELDYYRGVNSSFILRSLLIRGLVNRSTDQSRGNVYLYEPSFDLLKYLGVSNIEELPEYKKFKTMIMINDNDPTITKNES